MSILDTIKLHKLMEVEERKSLVPISLLEKSPLFDRPVISMKSALTGASGSGIIAEFKRKSPSKGDINRLADAEKVTKAYLAEGAAALSVLTDSDFFGALAKDFDVSRRVSQSPMLRKDFILDEYQVIETKSMGADVILLIAKFIPPQKIRTLAAFAKSLQLEVLLEVHNREEILENQNAEVDLIGINNRNLQTFEVDVENSIALAASLPKHLVKIAESGIESAETIRLMKRNGFSGFLIGEYFMRHNDPAGKCRELIEELNRIG
jgi:indole-3-glycerol phosphate synthase